MSNSDKSFQTIDLADELLYTATKPSKGKYRISYRGYKRMLLSEQLSSREESLLLCQTCEGVLFKASSDQSEEVLCECCVSRPDSTPLLPVRRIVSKLPVKCPQYFRGCEWSGFISDIREHVELCGYLYVSCPQGCDESMLQQHTEEHVTHKCIERMVLCDLCTKSIKVKNLTEHKGVCPMYPIECTNLCGSEVNRHQLEDHLKLDCPYRLVPCPYVTYGCDKTEIRFCDLKEHMDTEKDRHLSNLHLRYQTDIQRVEKDNDKLKKYIFPTLITVCLDVGCYQNVWQLTFGHGTAFKLKNETFYINLVREQNGRLYFVVQFPTQRKGMCLTILLNQDKSDESIMFQPMELNCKPKRIQLKEDEVETSVNFSYSLISSGIEDSLLRFPFVKDGKVKLKIGLNSSD